MIIKLVMGKMFLAKKILRNSQTKHTKTILKITQSKAVTSSKVVKPLLHKFQSPLPFFRQINSNSVILLQTDNSIK